MRLLLILTIGLSGLIHPPKTARAQNGQLIEGLFRTWANTQVEKEKRKRIEAETRAREAADRRTAEENRTPTGRDPYEVQLPSGFGRYPANQPGTITGSPARPTGPHRTTTQRRRPINVRSREAAEYGQSLVQFSADYDRLAGELRVASTRNAEIRTLMPTVFEVAATCDTLSDRLEGLESLSMIEASHRALDQRYRHVSFRIRSINGLSDRCRDLVRRCDQSCSAMSKRMGMEPQFDRRALRDLMITAATYMQTLMDDLELADINRNDCHSLQRECRLLRHRLIAAGSDIDEMPYDQCVTRFSDFIRHWNHFSESVYALDDPYLSRRLDRIGQCGDQSHSLLWMPPPASISQVSGIAHRIGYDLKIISQSMTFYSMADLPPRQQTTLLSTMRDLISLAGDLERRSQSNASRNELVSVFSQFDQAWCGIKPLLGEISSIKVGLIAETEHGCQQLRGIFDIRADYATPIRFADLVSVGAALEGTGEYLYKSLENYQRYLEPISYRKKLIDASRSFYHHSREVHELLSRTERLSDHGHLARLREEVDHLLTDWSQLSKNLTGLESHGLTGSRAVKIRRAQQNLVPLIGQIGAVLVQR